MRGPYSGTSLVDGRVASLDQELYAILGGEPSTVHSRIVAARGAALIGNRLVSKSQERQITGGSGRRLPATGLRLTSEKVQI